MRSGRGQRGGEPGALRRRPGGAQDDRRAWRDNARGPADTNELQSGFFGASERPEDEAARQREVAALLGPRRTVVQDLPADRIRPNPFQARVSFEGLEELRDAILAQGFTSRLRVRPDPADPGFFQLVYGERRLRAARLAGLDLLPCEVAEHSDDELLEIGLAENIQRQDLNPLEEARAFETFIRERGYSIRRLAERDGHDVHPFRRRYRRECFQVLWEAFRPQIVRAEDLAPPPGVSGAQFAYEIATAVQHLARQQLELEERLNAAGRWAKGMEGRVEVVEDRVTALELSVGPRSPIDDEQAAALAAAVRAVGRALEQRGTGDYRGVYGQLYARFGITSYKNLRREKYEQALAWLEEWHREITGEGAQETAGA